MPNPNKVEPISPERAEMWNQLAKNALNPHPTPESSEGDLSLLRKDIADLKALMTPSIILTGQRAIDEYWELTKRK